MDNLHKLREPFKTHQIGRLPKPTRSQTDAVKNDYKAGFRCNDCGGWHHPKVVHLDYVGHAALTDRFLEVDPSWNWEPLSMDDKGLPMLDNDKLLWIKLTICGVTRIGVGDAGSKQGGDAMKERIGDALRNAGMRFGAALDLWHKGELRIDEPIDYEILIKSAKNIAELGGIWVDLPKEEQLRFASLKDSVKSKLTELNNE